jgi:hypothetical protein
MSTVLQKATLSALPSGPAMPVQFNPVSIVYTVENKSQQQSRDPQRRQHISHCNAKLTMDLQFDTTDTGVDVRTFTTPVAAFMESSAAANKQGSGTSTSKTNAPAPPVLSFDWGAYHFQGFMESFKETIDFFSPDGIPLRALVSIGLARQDEVFSSTPSQAPSSSVVPTPGNGSVAAAAAQGGDPNATRALASANGVENPRFTGGAPLAVGSGIQLNGPVAFVASASVGGGIGISGGLGVSLSAGAGISAGAGAGFGIGGGASAGAGFGIGGGVSAGAGIGIGGGISAGAGFGIGASASASVGVSAGVSLGAGISVSSGAGAQVTLGAGGGALFGSSASAGVPATMGAFAGLEVGRATVSTTAQLDPLRMLPATVGVDVSVGPNASFGLGGVAMTPSGFSTNVSATASLGVGLTFDSD